MAIHHANWTDWVESGEWLNVREPLLPVSPSLIDEAMALAIDPDVSVHRIVRLVTKEQVLATRILRLANSASYAPVKPITTINDATVRVGTNAVRNALLAACVASRLEAAAVYGTAGRNLLDHSIGTAYLAQLIAESFDVEPEEALVCGLLHDIGKLVVLKLRLNSSGYEGGTPNEFEIASVLRDRHPWIGAQILRQWKLPDALREPVLYHHRPAASVLYPRQTRVTYVANLLSHRYGFGCTADTDTDLVADPVLAEHGLEEHWLREMDRRAPDRFAAARALLA